MNDPERTSSLRISHDQARRILDHLDTAVVAYSAEARAERRFRFRSEVRILSIQQADATAPSTFPVYARNLSAGGLAFIHTAYIRAGSEFGAQIRAVSGDRHVVTGTVVRCWNVEGTVHEVGVRFAQPIDPAPFLREEEPEDR